VEPAARTHLQSLSRRAFVVAPIRLSLGAAGVAAAIVAGSPRPAALLAFVLAAVALLAVVATDPRRRFVRLPDDPPEAEPEAPEDGLARIALAAVFPSTVGVAAILVVALAVQPTLAALLAGILAGLGVAALLTGGELLLEERRTGRRLFLVRGSQRVVSRTASRDVEARQPPHRQQAEGDDRDRGEGASGEPAERMVETP
jgi:hypothetical protein